jgi:hypothetical protein
VTHSSNFDKNQNHFSLFFFNKKIKFGFVSSYAPLSFPSSTFWASTASNANLEMKFNEKFKRNMVIKRN